jgi:type IV pilus assembly protein PilA
MMRINAMLRRRDEGFTLIELMVVVLIIGILIAIAIPTFLGARKRAQDRAAQSNLRNTVTNAKAIFTDRETYVDAIQAELAKAEPSLTYAAGAIAANDALVPDKVSIETPPPNAKVFYAADMAASGNCWYIRQSESTAAIGVGAGLPGLYWAKDTDASFGCDSALADAAGIGDTAAKWAKTPGAAPEL